MTSLEKRLLFVLADMVFQHCHDGMADIMSPECVFDSGFVRCNKDAIEILIDAGIMVEAYPEAKQRESLGRAMYAKFVRDWKLRLSEIDS